MSEMSFRFVFKYMTPGAVLTLILAIAFAVRIAGSFHPGYGFDVSVNQKWARSAAELGLAQSYKEQLDGGIMPEYPPMSHFVFATTGHLYKLFVTDEFDYDSMSLRIFIKLPAILADLIICVLLFYIVSRWKRKKTAGLLAAAIYGLHPTAIYDSAVWGQTDSIYTLFMVAALMAWIHKRVAASAILFTLSVLAKAQAVILLPIFLLVQIRKPRQLLYYAIVGIVTTMICLIPFMIGGSVQEVANVYLNAVGRYTTVSFGAYNFWWSLLADRAWEIQNNMLLFDLVSYKTAGFGLFGIIVVAILFAFRTALEKSEVPPFFHAAALLSGAFFLVLPEMHERYMFPFVALGVPLVFVNKRLALYYWAASLALLVNLLGILPFSAFDRALYTEFDTLDVFVAATIVWMMVLLYVEALIMYTPLQRSSTKKVTRRKLTQTRA